MKNTILVILLLTINLTSFSQNWNEMIKAVSSGRAEDDYFGYSVNIDNDRAIVSSYLEDEDALGGATLLSAGSKRMY